MQDQENYAPGQIVGNQEIIGKLKDIKEHKVIGDHDIIGMQKDIGKQKIIIEARTRTTAQPFVKKLKIFD